jgi:radical SAM-linked protein
MQRACVRAGIDLAYSEGFNPRPKLSLPLPRSVGIESDDELCSVQIKQNGSNCDPEQLKTVLQQQLPEGFELTSAEIVSHRRSFQKALVTYQVTVRDDFSEDLMTEKVKKLTEAEQLILQRVADKGKSRRIDVRPFLESIDVSKDEITVRCRFTPTGTVRIDELMQLLELREENLAGPVRRIRVNWEN